MWECSRNIPTEHHCLVAGEFELALLATVLFLPTQLTFLELLDYGSEGTPDAQLAFRAPGAILGGMVAVSEGPASALGSEELREGENSISPRCRCYRHGMMRGGGCQEPASA